MKYLSICCFLILCKVCQAQTISFLPKFQKEKLQLEKAFYSANDTLSISHFKFYITDLKYYQNDSLIYTSPEQAYLIDVSNANSLHISENQLLDFNSVHFKIGIDSLTNVSGVFNGDLDPTNGMYWTWQSGYINFKLEGQASQSPARKQKFYWHIGGYIKPFDAQRVVKLSFKASQKLAVNIQIEKLFEVIDVSKIYQVMSPNAQAMAIADQLKNLFKVVE